MDFFARPVPAWNEILHLFGEAGDHYPWHMSPGTGLWMPGRVCLGCKRPHPCGCMSPAPYGHHRGTDFYTPEVIPVSAVAAGSILTAGIDPIHDHTDCDTYRIIQEIKKPGYENWRVAYRRLSKIMAWSGTPVKEGDRIGRTLDDHLHVELIDPHGQYRPMDFRP